MGGGGVGGGWGGGGGGGDAQYGGGDAQYDEADHYLKWPCPNNFCNFCTFFGTLKFSIIGFGQEDEIEEITLRPEIWWHDAVYHEADDCMKWPLSANVCIF